MDQRFLLNVNQWSIASKVSRHCVHYKEACLCWYSSLCLKAHTLVGLKSVHTVRPCFQPKLAMEQRCDLVLVLRYVFRQSMYLSGVLLDRENCIKLRLIFEKREKVKALPKKEAYLYCSFYKRICVSKTFCVNNVQYHQQTNHVTLLVLWGSYLQLSSYELSPIMQ